MACIDFACWHDAAKIHDPRFVDGLDDRHRVRRKLIGVSTLTTHMSVLSIFPIG
jgi:hypothetical protein